MRSLFLALSIAGSVSVAHAGLPEGTVVKTAFGRTGFKLTPDGQEGVAILAHRENFNAHSFDVLSIYTTTSPFHGSQAELNIVPFFKGGKETLFLTVSGGADCLLHDFRLLSNPDGVPRLITAEREMGQSYADSETVSFDFYALKINAGGELGWPAFYFEKTGGKKSKGRYCDVGEAFKKELGLSDYR